LVNGNLVYVIIPARGGSKRLKNKNIHPVLGKPMLSYAIEASQNSRYIDRVFVSSESNLILKIASQFGATGIKRTKEKSLDHVYKQEAIVECLNALKENYEKPDIVISLQANSPEVLAKDLDSALEKFEKFNRDELMSFDTNLIQNAAFRIMRHDYVYQKTLSTKCGCFITDYVDIHTIDDILKVEKRFKDAS